MSQSNAHKRKATVFTPFEISDYLDNDEVIAEYLSEVMQSKDMEAFLQALSEVAKARGMSEVAKSSGLGRESLYKALSPGAKPRFETVAAVMEALNLRMAVTAR